MSLCFSDLLKTGSFSDFSLFVNGKNIKLHRAIIAERSGYFFRLFEKNPTAKFDEIAIPDDCVDYIEYVFEWIYSSTTFYVTKQTFGPIIRLAVLLDIPSLLSALLQWMASNITVNNTMFFYYSIVDILDKIDPEFMNVIIYRIILNFELLDNKDVCSLPFNIFYKCITDPQFLSSSYRLSSSISKVLSTNKSLSDAEKQKLVDLYIKTDWPASVAKIVNVLDENKQEKILEFAAKHFRNLSVEELSKMPPSFLARLFERDDLNAPNGEFVAKKLEALSMQSKANITSKKFQCKEVTVKDLKVLILASVYMDVLNDIKNTLIKGGVQSKNIVLFNADAKTPTDSFLFQFDTIFAFTHYQFLDSSSVGRSLLHFIENGGGLVTCYGFCRDDEWGCGNNELMKYMPLSRGPQLKQADKEKLIVTEHSLVEGITELQPGEFSPRTNAMLLEDAKLVASYSDNVPLVAYKDVAGYKSRVVSINFYPVTTRVHRLGYNPDQQWDKIFTRSVLYSCGLDPLSLQ